MTQPTQHPARPRSAPDLAPRMADVDRIVRAVLRDVLALSNARVDGFDDHTPLFGALPELDSMAVAGVLTEVEDRLGILIEDDEVDGAMLETFGALKAFAAAKVAARARG